MLAAERRRCRRSKGSAVKMTTGVSFFVGVRLSSRSSRWRVYWGTDLSCTEMFPRPSNVMAYWLPDVGLMNPSYWSTWKMS